MAITKGEPAALPVDDTMFGSFEERTKVKTNTVRKYNVKTLTTKFGQYDLLKKIQFGIA